MDRITLPQIISEEDRRIRFKDKLSLEWAVAEDHETHVVVDITFDFGMSFLWNVKKDGKGGFQTFLQENLTLKEAIQKDTEFSLFHAFFHTPDDPNYDISHWALYGNLKDRVDLAEDDEEFPEGELGVSVLVRPNFQPSITLRTKAEHKNEVHQSQIEDYCKAHAFVSLSSLQQNRTAQIFPCR
jgi:hypothetical protein